MAFSGRPPSSDRSCSRALCSGAWSSDASSQALVDDVRRWVRNAVSNHPEGLLANDLSVMLR